MAYPNAEDYVRAVQQPEQVFQVTALRRAVFDVHPLFGIPMPASGSAAVVFRARVEGTDSALRFFIREDASSRERYAALGESFREHRLEDCVASAAWVDDAIAVNGSTWPMVQMQWVEGRTLDAYVGHLTATANVGALSQLAGIWRSLVGRLQTAEFAHGDLQHGNVLVDSSSSLRLVDFDGSWVPALRDEPPPDETGNPNYQRPEREWGCYMDTFPGLVIYTALLALSRRPGSWERLHNGENLLFSRQDFSPPFRTPAWELVSGIGDPEVDHAAQRLIQACASDWRAQDTLEALLGRPRIAVPPPRPPQQAPERYVPRADPSAAWWIPAGPMHATGTTTAPGATPPGRAPGIESTATTPPSRMPPPPPKMPAPPPKTSADAGPAWQPSRAGGQGGPSWPHGGVGVPPSTPQHLPQPGPWPPSRLAEPNDRRPVPRAAVIVILLCVLVVVVLIVAGAGG